MTRKNLLLIRLILLILLFIAICAGGLIFFQGYGQHGMENGTSQSFSGVNKILVNSSSLPVRIVEGDAAEVTVTDNTRFYGFGFGRKNSVYQTDDSLYFNEGNRFSLIFGFTAGDVTIEVPRGTALEYQLTNTSGSISLDAPSKNTLKIKSTSGSVKVFQGGDHLDLTSTSGSVRIYSGFETARVKSTSGSIRISADERSRELNCNSTSGSVRIRLEHVSGYDLTYSSTSGSIRDLYHNISYERSGRNSYGDASLKINVKNTSGSTKLCDWD